jgi:hypothetical protein
VHAPSFLQGQEDISSVAVYEFCNTRGNIITSALNFISLPAIGRRQNKIRKETGRIYGCATLYD